MTIAIAPRQPAPQQQESFGAQMGTAIGGGLNQLIESKINDLNRQRGIKERKSTYAKAGLPEWLGELPDDFQQLFLKEFDFASPQEKEHIRQGVSQLGEQYYTPSHPGDDMEDEEQDQQQGMLPGQMMQGQQIPQQQGPATGAGLAGLQAQQMGMQQQERQIPGMNGLKQAGQGFQQEPTGSREAQSFPRLGHGTKGQPAPIESQESRPQFTRKGKGSAKAVEKGLTAAQSLKLEQDTEKKSEAKKHVQKAYDRVNEILDTGYTGFSLTGWTPEGRKQRNELDTLSEVFISSMIPLLNPKGTMSKERFNYIKNLAPNSWDMDATIKGKMDALKEIFDLEGSSNEKSSSSDSSDKPPQEMVSASPEGQIFYNDGVAKFIKKNGKLERV